MFTFHFNIWVQRKCFLASWFDSPVDLEQGGSCRKDFHLRLTKHCNILKFSLIKESHYIPTVFCVVCLLTETRVASKLRSCWIVPHNFFFFFCFQCVANDLFFLLVCRRDGHNKRHPHEFGLCSRFAAFVAPYTIVKRGEELDVLRELCLDNSLMILLWRSRCSNTAHSLPLLH